MHFASYYRWQVYAYLFAADGFPPDTRSPILDIGCKGAEYLQRFHAPMRVGLERNVAFIPRGAAGLQLVTGDATCLPFRPGSFGYVLFNDVIEHVEDDHTAVCCAAGAVAPAGYLWISTPALRYRVGPEAVTRRFERAWGHVRKGYHPETLKEMIGPGFTTKIILWPEPLIRAMQVPLWGLSRFAMPLARRIARQCFDADRNVYLSGRYHDALNGHIYLSAQRVSPN